MKIGIISDTHYGYPERQVIPDWIRSAFCGVDMIIHAGDVESPAALREFEAIAPVYAVRGNCDIGLNTPETINIEIGCGLLTAAHRASQARNAVRPETKVLVYGHTHIPLINDEGDLLVINPGSPSLPRGGLPASVAILTIENGKLSAELKPR
ncbi:MAG: metallophosphoesterase [Candidatus Rifleibacteriota bacterium]